MTQLINTVTKQVITESEFRAARANTSFGPVINFKDYGYEVVFPAPSPTVTDLQVAVEVAPVKTSKGHYEQTWAIQDKFKDIVVDGVTTTKAEQETAYLAAKKKALVPASVTMRQARLALLAADLLDDVDVMIQSIGRAAAITWEFATEVQRTNELIAAVQEAKGLTEEQIDDMFIEASKL